MDGNQTTAHPQDLSAKDSRSAGQPGGAGSANSGPSKRLARPTSERAARRLRPDAVRARARVLRLGAHAALRRRGAAGPISSTGRSSIHCARVQIASPRSTTPRRSRRAPSRPVRRTSKRSTAKGGGRSRRRGPRRKAANEIPRDYYTQQVEARRSRGEGGDCVGPWKGTAQTLVARIPGHLGRNQHRTSSTITYTSSGGQPGQPEPRRIQERSACSAVVRISIPLTSRCAGAWTPIHAPRWPRARERRRRSRAELQGRAAACANAIRFGRRTGYADAVHLGADSPEERRS